MERFSKMAIVTLLFAATVVSILESSSAQNLCNMSGQGLMACKPSVTPPNPTAPTATCCAALSHADLHCFCSYRNSPVLPSLGIDPNLAMQLPGKCGLPNSGVC